MEQQIAILKTTYDWGQSRVPLTELTDHIRETHGNAAEQSKIEKALLGVLESGAKYAAKQFACRQLSIIGTDQSVPVLSGMLTNDELSDMARYALERIPGDAADGALREALGKTKGKTKVGIINTLGERRDGKAVSALSGLVGNSDKMVAEAALAALGKIADSQATSVLAAAKGKVSDDLKMVALDAYLQCADKLLADGKKAEALAIYKELYKPDQPKLIRTAAMKGVVNATGAGEENR